MVMLYYEKRVENVIFFSFNNNINIQNQLHNNERYIRQNYQSSNKSYDFAKSMPTMEVIVGYIRKDDSYQNNVKLKPFELNHNNYSPIKGEGDLGRPVNVPFNYKHIISKYWSANQFNLLASDIISVDRNLSDVRSNKCKNIIYDSISSQASVIIIFHNEAWSTLIRTIRSVINRSPRRLIHEIILVDDASDREFLGQTLELFIAELEIMAKLYRMPQRSGLVASRLLGAEKANSEILIFLDSHCECTPGWLEPLLDRINSKKNVVICPVIDVIKDDTFEYSLGLPNTWGGFNWKMQFRWYNSKIRTNKKRLTYDTPTMAGGLFAIRKDYFQAIGTYDDEMTIWGGENLELSFRVWQCGGSIEIHPCSHVGHVFRKNSPYTFPGGVMPNLNRNLARLIEVWLDSYKNFAYFISPDIKIFKYLTNISSRIDLKNKLHCKNFDWYLQNIYPENYFPNNYTYFGKIIQKNTNLCLNAKVGINGLYSQLSLIECHKLKSTNQLFIFKKNGMIMTEEFMCLDSYELQLKNPNIMLEHRIVLRLCDYSKSSEKWTYDYKTNQLKNIWNNLCLTVEKNNFTSLWNLEMKKCSVTRSTQQSWIFSNISWIT
ncbi:polypeptide N-acetylgalactosaminyltransferase 1-like [Gordionus sp. m RMFG-2023]|uniref:polypeptide N-acetylgalactosaminyltransferase 1-like n=1 Tax=Gordionus sp. m RMFG-2023 TaxID=3053472 RepID=UPI0031FCCB2E